MHCLHAPVFVPGREYQAVLMLIDGFGAVYTRRMCEHRLIVKASVLAYFDFKVRINVTDIFFPNIDSKLQLLVTVIDIDIGP